MIELYHRKGKSKSLTLKSFEHNIQPWHVVRLNLKKREVTFWNKFSGHQVQLHPLQKEIKNVNDADIKRVRKLNKYEGEFEKTIRDAY